MLKGITQSYLPPTRFIPARAELGIGNNLHLQLQQQAPTVYWWLQNNQTAKEW